MTDRRRRAYRWGQIAEHFAAVSLLLKGYRIVARRYKTPVGEVDLIARRGDLVVFVEVKARVTHQAALDSITGTAQRRIEAAANWWISQQRDGARLSWRFDVITVVPRRWPRHHENVW
ncbi:MAG: YraN family protein [Rhizobiaceae bacterium]|nr:YraN family protein [Hyphomicrobiales bacterium]NRB30894.1 YraN family protein [Rhizobiaceae bacterium]